jgi:hypothetical protein
MSEKGTSDIVGEIRYYDSNEIDLTVLGNSDLTYLVGTKRCHTDSWLSQGGREEGLRRYVPFVSSIRHVTGPFPVSPVPSLVGEVTHQLDPTGHRTEPDMPVEMSSQWVITDLVSVWASLTIVYCRIKKLSTDNISSETLTQLLSNLESD